MLSGRKAFRLFPRCRSPGLKKIRSFQQFHDPSGQVALILHDNPVYTVFHHTGPGLVFRDCDRKPRFHCLNNRQGMVLAAGEAQKEVRPPVQGKDLTVGKVAWKPDLLLQARREYLSAEPAKKGPSPGKKQHYIPLIFQKWNKSVKELQTPLFPGKPADNKNELPGTIFRKAQG